MPERLPKDFPTASSISCNTCLEQNGCSSSHTYCFPYVFDFFPCVPEASIVLHVFVSIVNCAMSQLFIVFFYPILPLVNDKEENKQLQPCYLQLEIYQNVFIFFLYDGAEFYRNLLMIGGGCVASLQFWGLSTLSFLYYMSV